VIATYLDAGALARAAADRVLAAFARVPAERRFRLALSGGTTPEGLYALLASPGWRERLDPERIEIFFADERAVSPDHPDSNYGRARELLLAPLGIPADHVHRMRGEADDLEQAALEYESALNRPLDLVILGIGPDGHTASIFPRHAAASERGRRVVAVHDSPKPPPRRLTLTPRALDEAGQAMVLVTGAAKAHAVAAALAGACDPVQCPACGLRGRDWLLDAGAAAELNQDPPSDDSARRRA